MKCAIILIILAGFLLGCASVKVPPKLQCINDSHCVPAQCCHASECVPEEESPDCTGIFCTAECVPGTLDCRQGHCSCLNGKCTATFYS